MAGRSVNKVIMLGRLGKDAETKFTPSGIAKTTFSVATERRWKNQSGEWQSETDWSNVVLWRSENLAPYLTKGQQVYLEGRLSNRSYEKDGEKKYITEVVADEVILCGSKREGSGDGETTSRPRTGKNAPQQSQGGEYDPDDDPNVPF